MLMVCTAIIVLNGAV